MMIRKPATTLEDRMKRIRLLILDVDGVLTDADVAALKAHYVQ